MAGLNLFTNNASTTLASSILVGATSLTVAAGTGGLFPSLAGSQYFYCTLSNTAGTTIEIVKVTARSTDTFTIVRAQDNTTASAFSAGDKVELRLTAIDLQNFPQLDSTNTFAQAQTFSSPIAVSSGGTGASTANAGLANLSTFTSTATAASTTTLTNTSTYYQYFTGATTQTIVMPVTSTLSTGWSFHIVNNSTGNLTVNSSGANLIATVLPGTTIHITCIATGGTSASDWDYGVTDFNNPVPVGSGGTGANSLASGSVLVGNGTSAISLVAPGSTGNVLTSNGTTWTSAAAAAFDAGTRLAFQQTAAPTGWTKDTTAAINDSMLRLVTGTASSGGTTAFSTWSAVTSTGAFTLSTTEMPSHSHSYTLQSGAAAKGSGGVAASASTTSSSTGATGGGASHSHSLTRSLKYYDFIIASKN